MRPLTSSAFAVAICVVLAAACGGPSPPDLSVPATGTQTRLEAEMYERLNRDRAEHGLPPLSYDDTLADLGRAHSRDMVENAFFSHHSPTTGSLEDRLMAIEYDFATARENLALDVDVQSAQDSLLASPGHFANIVATDITHVGIGVVKDREGSLYVTQVFARVLERSDPESVTAAMREKVDQARSRANLPQMNWSSNLTAAASDALASLPERPSEQDLARVGQPIGEALAAEGLGVEGLEIVVQVVVNPDGLTVPRAAVSREAVTAGLAARRVEDPESGAAILVLTLVSLQ